MGQPSTTNSGQAEDVLVTLPLTIFIPSFEIIVQFITAINIRYSYH